MVVGSGYTLHYLDEETGEHVSVPIEEMEATRPNLVHDEVCVVTFDEAGTYTARDVARLLDRTKLWQDRDLGLAVTPDVEMPMAIHATLEMVAFDERALRRVFAKPDLDKLSPYSPLEKRRPDWQDRGPKHNNRKKRSWRR